MTDKTRRVTVPAGHIAVVMPLQLRTELMSLLTTIRRANTRLNLDLREGSDFASWKQVAADGYLTLLDASND